MSIADVDGSMRCVGELAVLSLVCFRLGPQPLTVTTTRQNFSRTLS